MSADGEVQVVCASEPRGQTLELLRGGVLMLFRWAVAFPMVYATYSVKGLMNAPWRRRESQGPVILVANHVNALYDVLICQVASPKWNFFLADSASARLPYWAQLLWIFRGVRLIRGSTRGHALTTDETHALFSQLSDLLVQGHSLNVFPEGECSMNSSLRPLRYGVASIAMEAAEKSGWALPLTIQPLGLNYENSRVVGSRCWAQWGDPIDVRPYRQAWLADRAGTEKKLLKEIEARLRAVVLEAPDIATLNAAHRLAYKRRRKTLLSDVGGALEDLKSGAAKPLTRPPLSRLSQGAAYGAFSVVAALGWPFRVFGRLAAKEPSQEVCYGFALWAMCLVLGFLVSDLRWALQFSLGSVIVARAWLWAWRRAIVS